MGNTSWPGNDNRTAPSTAAMTEAQIQAILDQLGRADRSPALALHALLSVAREDGTANFNEAATVYREDHLASLRATLWREEALIAPAPADRTFAGYGELLADPGYARA